MRKKESKQVQRLALSWSVIAYPLLLVVATTLAACEPASPVEGTWKPVLRGYQRPPFHQIEFHGSHARVDPGLTGPQGKVVYCGVCTFHGNTLTVELDEAGQSWFDRRSFVFTIKDQDLIEITNYHYKYLFRRGR